MPANNWYSFQQQSLSYVIEITVAQQRDNLIRACSCVQHVCSVICVTSAYYFTFGNIVYLRLACMTQFPGIFRG